MFYTNNRLRALAVGLALGLAPLPFPGGHAQAATAEAGQQQYNIAAGPLNTVLTRFADVSGSLIAGNLQLAADKQSPGVSGSFTPDQALTRILAGTGLVADRDPDGAYVLRDAEAAGTNKLSPVSVTAPTQYSVQNSLSYDRGRIEALQPQDMKDLFKNESSVSVGGSIPINQKVYVRGVEETAMLVTVDGARQNNKVFHHNATNLIDPSLLKATRASAGVAAADDGPGALGGSLAYETVVVGDLLAPGDSLGGFLDGRYASNGHTVTSAGSVFGRANGF